MIQEADADGNGVVDFPELLALLARKMKDSDTESKVLEAFTCFDRGGAGLSVEDLKRIMTNLGDKLSNEEVKQMLREAETEGVIDNEEFIRMMMAKWKTRSREINYSCS